MSRSWLRALAPLPLLSRTPTCRAAVRSLSFAEFQKVIKDWEDVIQGIFSFECAVKIVAEGEHPRAFFYDPWNSFDFFIVLLSLPFLNIDLDLALLRLVRLLRLIKLVRVVKSARIFTVLQTRYEMTFISISLIKLAVMCLVLLHWFSWK